MASRFGPGQRVRIASGQFFDRLGAIDYLVDHPGASEQVYSVMLDDGYEAVCLDSELEAWDDLRYLGLSASPYPEDEGDSLF